MFWGILIGIILTVLSVIIAMAAGCKNLGPLSYIVIVAAFIVFCIEGVMFAHAIAARRDTGQVANTLQGELLKQLPADARDYRVGSAEATGLKTFLVFTHPDVARHIKTERLVGRTVDECSAIVRTAVLRSASRQIWMSLLYMVITLAVGAGLLVACDNIGGGGRSTRRGGRAHVHGRPRRASSRRR